MNRNRLICSLSLSLSLCFAVLPSVSLADVGRNLSEVGGTCMEVADGPADRAQVVFYLGDAGRVHATLMDGDTFISHVISRTCFVYEAAPGQHLFSVVGEAADFLEADVAAGKTYWIEVVPRMGGWKPRFSLLPYNDQSDNWEKKEKRRAKSILVEPTPDGFAWAEARTEELAEKRAEYFAKWQEKPADQRPSLAPDDGI